MAETTRPLSQTEAVQAIHLNVTVAPVVLVGRADRVLASVQVLQKLTTNNARRELV